MQRRPKERYGAFFLKVCQTNPLAKQNLAEIDILAKRYGLDPVGLFYPECENPFLRLAMMRKIAEFGIEYEAEAMEQAQREHESKQNH